ncbi:MAG: hypothetical protein IPJ19_04530 [Planctomycetes bacterium]|nr:hypothetical protein [Planctomycetota bacterium]
MSIRRFTNENSNQRGAALAMIILSVAGMAALTAAMMTVGLGSSREQEASNREDQAAYICQAGLSQSMYQMQRGVAPSIGTSTQPQAWGGGRFWVDSVDMGSNLTRLTANGLDNGVGKSQELVVRAVPSNMWTYALFGKDSISLDSSVKVDSYNSTLGTYASQSSGAGIHAHALVNGSVGSNGNISAGSQTNVWGNATPGPGHTVSLHEATVSGSIAPSAELVTYPAINVPTYTNYGALNVSANTTMAGGERTYTNIRVRNNKTLTITGPADVVMSNLTMDSNSWIVINDAAGPVTLTIIDNFKLDSNSNIWPASKDPSKLRINMLSDNVADPEVIVQLDTVSISSNSTIYGCVYAPEARIVLDSNFSLYGSLMARSLNLDSNCNFHFDENLLSALSSGSVTYEMVSWREVPFHN